MKLPVSTVAAGSLSVLLPASTVLPSKLAARSVKALLVSSASESSTCLQAVAPDVSLPV